MMPGGAQGLERAVVLLVYLAATVVAIVIVNAGDSNLLAIVLWWSASILLGWRWRLPWIGLVALLAIPFSIPFGYADSSGGGDAPWVPLFAIVGGGISAALIGLSALAASVVERRREAGSR